MPGTTQVALDAKLYERLRQVAEDKGDTPEVVLNKLARDYVRKVRREKLAEEQEHYKQMHPALKDMYYGQHVAIHDGQLVDHDPDLSVLVRRINDRFGDTPVLITDVWDKPIHEYVTHSMRLVRDE